MRILPTFPLCFHRHIVTYVCRGDLCAHEQAKSSPFFAPQAKCQFLSEAFSDLLQTKLNTPSKFSLKHLSQITIIYLFRFTSLMSPLPPGYYFHEGRDYICSLYPRLSVNTQHSAGHIVSVQYILWMNKFRSTVKMVWNLFSPESGMWQILVCSYILQKIWDVSAQRPVFIEVIIKVKPTKLYSWVGIQP